MVVLTHNKSSKNYTSADVLQYIRTISTNIIVQKNGFEIKIADEPTPCCFKWYKAPSTLPNDLEKTYIEERPMLIKKAQEETAVAIQVLPKMLTTTADKIDAYVAANPTIGAR